ncbi:hypothetical protein SAMN05428960_0516 [Mitsuaria sp. PDC51]|uniref:hypothetical protein n=1 Tax=Mitsuaria sp. PDC51 TaxID=1881035 RepID=UPI0008F03646|nr:hypothetical protein [Mitsuaria sp. PDC51]SFR72108.1 hypothetical protein SAMN05428960_0516 [Mitsuaria sp. PDC51]
MSKHHFKIYFSDIFEVSPESLEDYGAFNISLINDLPLFVDPFLLFNSKHQEYQRLHSEMIKYMLFLKENSNNDLPPGLIRAWYYFPEVKENWFGFSEKGNGGRGLGADFAKSLKRNMTSVFRDFGDEKSTGTHLGKLTLIKNGVGKDQISDFTCNLIRGFLASYTETFATKHIDRKYLQRFNIPKVDFNYTTRTWASGQYLLPKFGNEFVLLTPVDILTKDEAWISHKGFVEDFSAIMSSVDNETLRSQIEQYFVQQLPTEATRREVEKAIETVVSKYPELLDVYVKRQEDAGAQATSSSAGKVQAAQQLFVKSLKALVELLDKTQFYQTGRTSYEEGMQRVLFLKHVIEKQDGYRIFYIKGKPIKREKDLQIMFKLTWFASDFSADAEVNNGRGPADFQVSYGSADKSIIEFKLASNSQIEKNLRTQAEIYSDASRATHPPIKAILYFKLEELAKVQRIMRDLKLEKCKDIVFIDATEKESASKS